MNPFSQLKELFLKNKPLVMTSLSIMRIFIKLCDWEYRDAAKNEFIRYFDEIFSKFLLLIERCYMKYHVMDELFLQLDVMKTF